MSAPRGDDFLFALLGAGSWMTSERPWVGKFSGGEPSEIARGRVLTIHGDEGLHGDALQQIAGVGERADRVEPVGAHERLEAPAMSHE